jgi:SAM-dependent methyltransferase
MSKQRDVQERFHERYSSRTVESDLIVEREVIGANVGANGGANGYTTVRQADLLARCLGLTNDHLLLDIGSGRGWPGIYLAEKTGCRAVLIDLPPPALRAAVKRADKRLAAHQVSIVRGSATHLPFASRSYDAVCHTDTL